MTMLTVVCIGVFLSTLTDSTAASVVGTVVSVVTSNVLGALPGLSRVKPSCPRGTGTSVHNLVRHFRSMQDMWKGLASTLI